MAWPESQKPLRRGRGQEIALGEDLPGEPGPDGRREPAEVGLIPPQVQPPNRGFRLCRDGRRPAGGGGMLQWADEKSPAGQGVEIALRLQLAVGALHGDDRHPQCSARARLEGRRDPAAGSR